MSEFIKILEDRSESLISKIQSNMIAAGITATGKTAQGLGYTIVQEGERLTLNITANKFTQVVETGRKPTPEKKPSYSMIQNITEWVAARGLDSSIVWAIAMNIQKEGTKLWQTGGRKDIYTMPFDEFVKLLQQDILGETTDTFIKTVLKSWQQAPRA